MAKINGTDLRVYKDGNLIGYEREFTFSLEMDLPDSSNKDSGGFAEHIQGQGSATLEFTAMVDFTSDYGIAESLAELIARTCIYVSWKDTVNGIFYAGKASYSSISSDASNEDVMAWNGSITINGDWGIYPTTITRTLRTSNTLMSFNAPSIFGIDKDNSFYYIDNATGAPFRLKNAVETNLTSAFDNSDFIGVATDGKCSYVPYPAQADPNIYKISKGVKSEINLFDNGQLFNIHTEDGFAYCCGVFTTNIEIIKQNIKTGDIEWTTDTTYIPNLVETFQIIKQGGHIVLAYKVLSGSVWKLDVFNESTGAFIRTITVVTDADTVGVWMAALGTSLYLSYGDGTNTYLKKLLFNGVSFSAIVTTLSSDAVSIVRQFNNNIYYCSGGTQIAIYNQDILIGNIDLSVITNTITD
jgi:hypothetical protein